MQTMIELIKELVEIHSPSGYTENIINFVENKLTGLDYVITRTKKGALLVGSVPTPKLVISAHIDTLGGMVKYINTDGTLEITQIGGWPPNSFEGEYVTVLTSAGKSYRGTFLLNNPAAHVNREVSKTERKMEKMHIRLDAVSFKREETEKLGVTTGDYVFFDPRFELTETGYVKSRFMDDKACAGINLDLLITHADFLKAHSIGFFFSNYEEVGHGGSAGLPSSIEKLLVTDMGVIGERVEGKETAVSICAKDSGGPYDFEFRQQLVALAKSNSISYQVDVFPYYGSDGGAALAAGMDVKVGLIGPGVSSSHGVERTHLDGIQATKDLILALIKEF